MKISQFNVFSHIQENGNVIVYNTHTTACVVLNDKCYNDIFVERRFDDYKNEVDYLFKNGILIDDTTDELALLENIRKNYMDKPIQNIVILTTTECNARCYYCFEHGIAPVVMTKETANALIKFIKDTYKEKKLAISWFGGEPLLNFEIIEYITLKLKDFGYELEAHTTTNGSLLNEEMLDFFQQHYEKYSFQITLDAIGDEYGKIKRYVDIDQDKAFDRVLNNVKMIAQRKINLIVRVNFAASQIEKAKNIYSNIIKLLDGCDLSTTYIYMAPLTLDNNRDIISNFNENIEHPFLQMVKSQISGGFPLNKLRSNEETSLLAAFNLTPTAVSCGMTLHTRIVVNADGVLYKCHRLAGKKQFAVGDIFNGTDKNNEILNYFYNEKITDEQCKKCNILPICQGGCKYQRLIYGDKQKCHRIKQVKEELVRLYYNALTNQTNKET